MAKTGEKSDDEKCRKIMQNLAEKWREKVTKNDVKIDEKSGQKSAEKWAENWRENVANDDEKNDTKFRRHDKQQRKPATRMLAEVDSAARRVLPPSWRVAKGTASEEEAIGGWAQRSIPEF